MPCNEELDSREIFVHNESSQTLERLPSKAVESPSLETSKMWLDKAFSNQIELFKLVPTLKLAWL